MVGVVQLATPGKQVGLGGCLYRRERRGVERDDAAPDRAAPRDLDHHGALSVIGFAEVHAFDAAAVADVRMAHVLRFVDVAKRYVIPRRKVAALNRDVLRLGQVVGSTVHLGAADQQVGGHDGWEPGATCRCLVGELGDAGADGLGEFPVPHVGARPAPGFQVVPEMVRIGDACQGHCLGAVAARHLEQDRPLRERHALRRSRAEQVAGCLQQREHRLPVMVAREENHAQTLGDAWSQELCEAADQSAELNSACLVEHVTRDEQEVHLLRIDDLGELGDASECVVRPVDPADAGAEVPIAGVEDLHGYLSSSRCRGWTRRGPEGGVEAAPGPRNAGGCVVASALRIAHGGRGKRATRGWRKVGASMTLSPPPIDSTKLRRLAGRKLAVSARSSWPPVRPRIRMEAFSTTRVDTREACCWAPSRITPRLRSSAATVSTSRVIGSVWPRGAKRLSSSMTNR